VSSQQHSRINIVYYMDITKVIGIHYTQKKYLQYTHNMLYYYIMRVPTGCHYSTIEQEGYSNTIS